MKSLFSLLLTCALLVTGTLPAHAAEPVTPESILAASKQAYLAEYKKDIAAQVSAFFQARKDAIAQTPGTGSFTLDLTAAESASGSTNATLAVDYIFDKDALTNITKDTPVADLIRRIGADVTLTPTITLTPAQNEPSTFQGTFQFVITGGILYLQSRDLSTTGLFAGVEEEKSPFTANTWAHIDLVKALPSEDMTAEEAARALSSDNLALLSAFNAFTSPSPIEEAFITTLITDYLTEVYGQTPLLTLTSGDTTSAQLTFGKADMQRIINANFQFILRKYSDLLTAAKIIAPFDPVVLTSPKDIKDARKDILAARKEMLAAVSDFTPVSITATFEKGAVANLRALHTTRSESGNSSHADIRYYLNGSSAPADHSIHALFAYRGKGDRKRSEAEVKLFPRAADNTLTVTFTGIVQHYATEMDYDTWESTRTHAGSTSFNGELTLDALVGALAHATFTADTTDKTAPFETMHSDLAYTKKSNNTQTSIAVTTTPEGIFYADGSYAGTPTAGEGNLTISYDDSMTDATASISFVHTGDLTSGTITLSPEAASSPSLEDLIATQESTETYPTE